MQGRYERALAFATGKHKGQFRIGGDEFITHPIAVCELVRSWGYDEEYQIVALFHDLLEDTDTTDEEIVALAGERVLEAVKALTKEKGYNIEEYIASVKADPIAFVVKTADRLHNLRCAIKTDESFRRKYIAETQKWYMDFSDEICEALEELKKSLD